MIHATVGVIPVSALQKAEELAFAADVFGAAKITALELYTYPMELLGRYDLP